MPKRPGILTGTAGVYYVAYQLAARRFHAAVTYGNAPTVDILVALLDGAATLSLQVKTASWARVERGKKGAKTLHHYEWAIGEKGASVWRPDLFFALVDLKSTSGELPDVFIIPSRVIYDAFEPARRSGSLKWWRYHPGVDQIKDFKNNWNALSDHLKKTTIEH